MDLGLNGGEVRHLLVACKELAGHVLLERGLVVESVHATDDLSFGVPAEVSAEETIDQHGH